VAFRNPENTLVAASRNATEGVPYRLNVSNAKKTVTAGDSARSPVAALWLYQENVEVIV